MFDMALFHDPNWPRASEWLAGNLEGSSRASLGLIDVPANISLSESNCEIAPQAIREACSAFSLYDIETGFDVADVHLLDHGTLGLAKGEFPAEDLRFNLSRVVGDSDALVILGGDNSITLPGALSLHSDPSRIGVITLDSHLDIRSLDNGPSNGNPIRGLLESGVPGENIVQVGIHAFTNSSTYIHEARNAGIRQISMLKVHERGIEVSLSDALHALGSNVEVVYFDLDLDTLDQSFCPGCPGSRPGGLAPWQMIHAARFMGRQNLVQAMDLVELDPTRDLNGVVSRTAATCLLAFASGVLVKKIGRTHGWA